MALMGAWLQTIDMLRRLQVQCQASQLYHYWTAALVLWAFGFVKV